MSQQVFVVASIALFWISGADINKVSTASVSKGFSPVRLDVYYESLCPDSIAFITKQLWPTFQTLSDVMKVELIPFGFGEETLLSNSTYSYKCHHGANECYGNLVQTCAINLLNDISKSLPFINCMEATWHPHKHAEKCANELNLDYQSIANCVQSQNGNQWQHEMVVKTNNLVPPLTYVPWIVIDGKSEKNIQDESAKNLLGLICSLYKGEKPKSCPSTS